MQLGVGCSCWLGIASLADSEELYYLNIGNAHGPGHKLPFATDVESLSMSLSDLRIIPKNPHCGGALQWNLRRFGQSVALCILELRPDDGRAIVWIVLVPKVRAHVLEQSLALRYPAVTNSKVRSSTTALSVRRHAPRCLTQRSPAAAAQ